MKTPRLDPLLNDLLAGEEAAPCRNASLEHMLASVRRCRVQRRHRRLVCALTPLMLALALLAHRAFAPHSRPAADLSTTTGQVAAAAALAKTPPAINAPVRFLSDDELLNLFPDRSVALVHTAGQQRFVFLDEPPEPAPSEP